MPATLDQLLDAVTAQNQAIEDQKKETATLKAELTAARERRNTGAVPAGAPAARRGEDIMSSRGFRFGKMMSAISNPTVDYFQDNSKIEREFCSRLTKKMQERGWRPDHGGSSLLAPIWPAAFPEDQFSDADFKEMNDLMYAGVEGADPDEMRHYGKSYRGKAITLGNVSPSLSYLDQSAGGAFVPPPTFGPPIELLRNNAVVLRAGATTVPLGPSGSIQMPRLTAATQGGWSGENVATNPVNVGTGLMTLAGKKVIAVICFANELLRYGSPAAEALIRNDLFMTVGLIADKGYLEGPGTNTQPKGLATMGSAAVAGGAPAAGASGVNGEGINVVTPTASNVLAPQDWYEFRAAIESQNATATGWVLHPKLYYAALKSRWTPYSGGTSQGGFVFDNSRSLADDFTNSIAGLPAYRSTQVSRTRGSGAQTYVICANWPDVLVGLFGAIEFTQTNQGANLVAADQTMIRAIMITDSGPRHPGAVAIADALNFSVAG